MDGRCRRRRDQCRTLGASADTGPPRLPVENNAGGCTGVRHLSHHAHAAACHAVSRRVEVFTVFIRCRRSISPIRQDQWSIYFQHVPNNRCITNKHGGVYTTQEGPVFFVRRTGAQRRRHDRRRIRCPFRDRCKRGVR
jgi:hypothetical protein